MQKRNSKETQQRLLAAGAELFDKKGYHNVSIKEVGRAAGCNSALISYHFGCKQALYQAVVNGQLEELFRLEKQIEAEGGSPVDQLIRYLQAILNSQLDPEKHLTILYRELLTPSGLVGPELWERLKGYGKYLKKLLLEAEDEGLIIIPKKENMLDYTTFILQAVTELLFLVKDRPMPLNPEGNSNDKVLKDMIQFILEPLRVARKSKEEGAVQ